MQRLAPKQERAAIAIVGVARGQDRRRSGAHAQKQSGRECGIVGDGAIGSISRKTPAKTQARLLWLRSQTASRESNPWHRGVAGCRARRWRDRARARPPVTTHLITKTSKQTDDGARQSPLNDGNAVRDEGADQQDGNVTKPNLGKIHDGEGKGAYKLRYGPAQANPPAKIPDKRKLTPHVEKQDVGQCRDLSRDVRNDDNEQASGCDYSNNLAKLTDRSTPRLNHHDPSIKSASTI